ncbi:MAG: alcohol dehydrogenase [Candidatus Thorarchaeota archaeon]|nr:MAG: alcohol dehydrogenase [Candidatus Thorarchaeota archaeon]
MKMPRTSRAAVVPEPNAPLVIKEFEIPELRPGAALLKVANGGVCGTDVHLWHGKLAGVPYPLILGHEAVGRIEAIGDREIRDLDGNVLTLGDRVAFHDVHDTCYACWNCLIAKAPTKCTNRKVYGITMDSTKWPYLIGGHSEYMYLLPGTHIIKIPDNVSFDGAAAVGCALPTAVHTVHRSPLGWGKNVVVQGAGPVGLMIGMLAKINGAATITMIDQAPNRLEMTKKFGATHTLNIRETTLEERKQELLDITGGHGPDIVYEATGSALAIPEGIELVREGGAYTICGQYTDSGTVEINPHLMNRKHLDIRTVWGSETTHVYQAVKTIAQNYDRFPFESLVTHRFTLDEAQKALETQESHASLKAVISPHRKQ